MTSINPAVSTAETVRVEVNPAARRATPAPGGDTLARTTDDAVELSPIAVAMAKLQEFPEIREELVARVRGELDAGTYDIDGKLDQTAREIIDEINAGL